MGGIRKRNRLQVEFLIQAKNILLRPNKSIAEGFEYPQYFSRLFKKKEGLSPSKYIEKYKINSPN